MKDGKTVGCERPIGLPQGADLNKSTMVFKKVPSLCEDRRTRPIQERGCGRMGNVVNLDSVRALLESGQTFEQIFADAQNTLKKLLGCDVSELDERTLGETRDQILTWRYVFVLSSPESRKRVEGHERTRNRALSADEVFELLAPELAVVRVRFA